MANPNSQYKRYGPPSLDYSEQDQQYSAKSPCPASWLRDFLTKTKNKKSESISYLSNKSKTFFSILV